MGIFFVDRRMFSELIEKKIRKKKINLYIQCYVKKILKKNKNINEIKCYKKRKIKKLLNKM